MEHDAGADSVGRDETRSGGDALVIGIPTFKRPDDLARLLERLIAAIDQALGERLVDRIDVLVVDNDPTESARSVAESAALRPLYVVERQPGVAAVRNRVLRESGGYRYLVFVDDDETPERDTWLVNLLRTAREYGAHVVAGSVKTVVEGGLDPWVEAGGFFARAHRLGVPTGASIDEAATNNLLLDLAFVRSAGVQFDEAFGLTGGEDSLFTSHLHRAGARMVWCADAPVLDHLPVTRQTREHALRRTRGMATTGVRVAIALAPSRRRVAVIRARAAATALARVGVGGVLALAGRVSKSQRLHARGWRQLMRGIGQGEAVVGHVRAQYGDGAS